VKLHAPESIEEAVALLAQDANARCLAGGQSLVAMMNAKLLSPTALISLRRISALSEVSETQDGVLRAGAMTTHAAMARLAPSAPGPRLVVEIAAHIAHPAVRNQGTIGGSLAHADPAADYPVGMVCTEARILAAGAAGLRVIPADVFFRGYYETSLQPGEIVTAVDVPPGPANATVHYEKFSLVDGDFAVVSAAVILAMERGRCTEVRIAVGASAPSPVRVAEAEAMLAGTSLGDDVLRKAGACIADACDPVDDFRGSAAYRLKIVPRIVARAVRAAQAKQGAHDR